MGVWLVHVWTLIGSLCSSTSLISSQLCTSSGHLRSTQEVCVYLSTRQTCLVCMANLSNYCVCVCEIQRLLMNRVWTNVTHWWKRRRRRKRREHQNLMFVTFSFIFIFDLFLFLLLSSRGWWLASLSSFHSPVRPNILFECVCDLFWTKSGQDFFDLPFLSPSRKSAH